MRVINNNRVYFVKWKYESPTLLRILQERGIEPLEALEVRKEGGAPALLAWINGGDLPQIKALPIPTVTHCIITNEDKEELFKATVRKFPADPYSKDKARKYSLGKLLTHAFPGENNKETRKNFWTVYLNRHEASENVIVDVKASFKELAKKTNEPKIVH